MTPAWILDILAAVMLVVAAVSAARLTVTRSLRPGPSGPDIDVAHLLMAIAMAGMLVASLSTLSDTAWEVIFGLLTAWFAVRTVLDARANGAAALAGGHCAPHLVHSAAMLYMFLATTMPGGGAGGMAGMGGMSGGTGPAMMTLDYPTLALAFALVLVGYSVWDIDQLSAARYRRVAARISLAGAGIAEVTATGTPEASADGTVPVAGAGAAGAVGGVRGVLLSPGVTVGCRVAMGIVMVFILLIAI